MRLTGKSVDRCGSVMIPQFGRQLGKHEDGDADPGLVCQHSPTARGAKQGRDVQGYADRGKASNRLRCPSLAHVTMPQSSDVARASEQPNVRTFSCKIYIP